MGKTSQEIQVFDLPFTEDNYADINFTDNYDWNENDKKRIKDLIWSSAVLNAIGGGKVEIETKNGKLIIYFEDSNEPGRDRYKEVKGFLCQQISSPPLSTSDKPQMVTNSINTKLKHYEVLFKDGSRKYCDAVSWKRCDDRIEFINEDGGVDVFFKDANVEGIDLKLSDQENSKKKLSSQDCSHEIEENDTAFNKDL